MHQKGALRCVRNCEGVGLGNCFSETLTHDMFKNLLKIDTISMCVDAIDTLSSRVEKTEKIDMSWSPDRPFNDIPLLPPQQELETKAVLKACIPAHAALSGLAKASELLPHQGLLINLLPLMEAKDSSEIENIVTTTDRRSPKAFGGS